MESTLLRSRRSSSNCSRIVGVIRERTISVRFSRLMCKKPRPRRDEAKTSKKTQGGEVPCWRGGSCGAASFRSEVHPKLADGVGAPVHRFLGSDAVEGLHVQLKFCCHGATCAGVQSL